MSIIHVLDNNTIDKIAAGEVVERPVSIVKELVENSIDAGATIITVEIKEGGLKLIRVTDNGSGIESSQIKNAFMSHATSKIESSDDLKCLSTLGFRGEALSSIAAVSRVEVTSRTPDSLEGIHYTIEGSKETGCEPVGAPVGTTFIVRDIFFNTLPRLKFLKTAASEGNMIADMMEHIALSMPAISFQFIMNGSVRFSTSGQGDLREVIYRIYGKDTAQSIREISVSDEDGSMRIYGYLGMPAINRPNRSYEVFFVNHRFVKSKLLSSAVEEGYIEYLMQHKFPFCVLNFDFDPSLVDVNVHPTKQEVRISDEKAVYERIVTYIAECLSAREMLDDAQAHYNAASSASSSDNIPKDDKKTRLPESFEQNRINQASVNEESVNIETAPDEEKTASCAERISFSIDFEKDEADETGFSSVSAYTSEKEENKNMTSPDAVNTAFDEKKQEYESIVKNFEQASFANDERILSEKARREYVIIGQVFKTYWLIEYHDTLMIMDQHAAHEKVNFERFMTHLNNRQEIPSQLISPPVIYSLNNREMQVCEENLDHFEKMGFTIEVFGDHEIAIRSVPMDLYGEDAGNLVGEIITDLLEMKKGQTPDSIRTRIATMACKASVKGNNRMSVEEVETLLDEMLTLDNPYNCPHGRPTLITMSKYEMDKRFHRIV